MVDAIVTPQTNNPERIRTGKEMHSILQAPLWAGAMAQQIFKTSSEGECLILTANDNSSVQILRTSEIPKFFLEKHLGTTFFNEHSKEIYKHLYNVRNFWIAWNTTTEYERSTLVLPKFLDLTRGKDIKRYKDSEDLLNSLRSLFDFIEETASKDENIYIGESFKNLDQHPDFARNIGKNFLRNVLFINITDPNTSKAIARSKTWDLLPVSEKEATLSILHQQQESMSIFEYTASELQFFELLYKDGIDYIDIFNMGKTMGIFRNERTINSMYIMRGRLELPPRKESKAWDLDEENFLIENRTKYSLEQIASRLERHPSSVSNKLSIMKIRITEKHPDLNKIGKSNLDLKARLVAELEKTMKSAISWEEAVTFMNKFLTDNNITDQGKWDDRSLQKLAKKYEVNLIHAKNSDFSTPEIQALIRLRKENPNLSWGLIGQKMLVLAQENSWHKRKWDNSDTVQNNYKSILKRLDKESKLEG